MGSGRSELRAYPWVLFQPDGVNAAYFLGWVKSFLKFVQNNTWMSSWINEIKRCIYHFFNLVFEKKLHHFESWRRWNYKSCMSSVNPGTLISMKHSTRFQTSILNKKKYRFQFLNSWYEEVQVEENIMWLHQRHEAIGKSSWSQRCVWKKHQKQKRSQTPAFAMCTQALVQH